VYCYGPSPQHHQHHQRRPQLYIFAILRFWPNRIDLPNISCVYMTEEERYSIANFEKIVSLIVSRDHLFIKHVFGVVGLLIVLFFFLKKKESWVPLKYWMYFEMERWEGIVLMLIHVFFLLAFNFFPIFSQTLTSVQTRAILVMRLSGYAPIHQEVTSVPVRLVTSAMVSHAQVREELCSLIFQRIL